MNLNNIFLSTLKNNGFIGDIATEKSVTVTYATDNSIYEVEPDAVIFPKNSQDVELIFNLLRKENFHLIKITARGGGTSTNGQSINSGIIVDYSRYMNRILKIDADKMTAEVEPGVILDVLNKELEKYNLFFPPNISPSNRATIGGMVNTDACGKGSCTYGRTSDNIESLDLHLLCEEKIVSSKIGAKDLNEKLISILSKAQDIYSSKHLARTTTGYNIEKSFFNNKLDLNYLISGSEGTLALVSKVTVKLKKLPLKKRLVLLRYKNFDYALKDARKLISLNPTAIETIDENVIRLARNDIIWQDVGHLIGEGNDTSINIVEFAYDNLEDFDKHKNQLHNILSCNSNIINVSHEHSQGSQEIRHTQNDNTKFLFENYFIAEDKNQIANIWNLRKQGVGLLGAMKGKRRPLPFVEDTIVPPSELASYISGFREVLKKYGVRYGMFGHVDAGCLHVRPALNMRQQADRELIRKISDEVCNLLLKHHGIIWGEHGKGFRSEYSEKFLGEKVVKVFSEIKKTFDPKQQLNYGKISALNSEIAKIDNITTRGFLDEKISSEIHDDFENILSCNGNALCFNLDKASPMCPSYKVSGDRRFSPKGRAMLFKEWIRNNPNLPSIVSVIAKKGKPDLAINFTKKVRNLFSKNFESEIYESFSKCLGCKACNTQCPIKVSIPDAKSYFLSHYFRENFRKPQDYLIGNIEKFLIIFGKFPKFFNFVTQNKIAKFIVRKIFGVTDILPITKNYFSNSFILDASKDAMSKAPNQSSTILVCSQNDKYEVQSSKNRDQIYLLCDAYTNYFHAEELQNSYELLVKLGFDVEFTKVFENGKALHAKGFLNAFTKTIKRNISYLKTLNGTLITIDPSISLTYRDEYSRFNNEKIEVLYLAEFLHKIEQKINVNYNKNYHLILHCSEQTNFAKISDIWVKIFANLGINLNILKIGCCGMSGSFGMEVSNFKDSEKIFEMNWQESIIKLSQNSDNIIMTAGSSCKSQVERFMDYKIYNPVSVINSLL
ncbi:MAG: FAD-binding oxidoreductase [Pelagibacterales bacterium]|nr:FAD-binding oxidoreductase [Pelagibacterales bacterium]